MARLWRMYHPKCLINSPKHVLNSSVTSKGQWGLCYAACCYWPLKTEPIGCPETSVNYQHKLRNIPRGMKTSSTPRRKLKSRGQLQSYLNINCFCAVKQWRIHRLYFPNMFFVLMFIDCKYKIDSCKARSTYSKLQTRDKFCREYY